MATNEQLIHDVTCVFDGGKFILGDLPEPIPEVFTVRFTTPEVFTQGNVIQVEGRDFPLRTPAGINATSAFFRAGTVFHCDIDFGKGYAYAWNNVASTAHNNMTSRDAVNCHPTSAIDHRGLALDAILDQLESGSGTVEGGAPLPTLEEGIGQWTTFSGTGSNNVFLPTGGTWAFLFGSRVRLRTGTNSNNGATYSYAIGGLQSGISAGGTKITSTYGGSGLAWRIS